MTKPVLYQRLNRLYSLIEYYPYRDAFEIEFKSLKADVENITDRNLRDKAYNSLSKMERKQKNFLLKKE